ncbi:MAG: RsmD family RNA methyltransferase [Candidatus Caldarchaeum sp.]
MPVFFLLSGENPALSAAELQHLLTIYISNPSFKIIDERIAVAEVGDEVAKKIVFRAAYTKAAAKLIAQGVSTEDLAFRPDWRELCQDFHTFEVSVVKLGETYVHSVEVEKQIAKHILSELPHLRINLSNPEVTFLTAVSAGHVAVGRLIASKPKLFFADRKAGIRPFRIPSALQPKLARCLVNLSVLNDSSKVLDPFAGSGAVVVEAGLMGHESVGIELKTWISEGMKRNVETYSHSTCHVIQADSRHLPFRKAFDSVATDPPYGRSATLAGMSFKTLFKRFAEEVLNILNQKARIAVTVPTTYYSDLIDACEGFRHEAYFDLYVHKSLTRRVVVIVHE